MKFVKQKAEIIEKSENKINSIANIARVCYKSENKADDENNIRLVKNLINNKHFAMLEHEDLIVKFENDFVFNQFIDEIVDIEKRFGKHLYFYKTSNGANNIISGNLRAWRDFWKYTFLALNEDKMQGDKILILPLRDYFLDNIFFDDILSKYSKEYIFFKNDNNMGIKQISKDDLSTKYDIMAHYRISAKIITDRGISHELVRHRSFSFAQESTRYVNYSKKSVEFIDYTDFKDEFNNERSYYDFMLYNRANSERATNFYKDMIKDGALPQFARTLLPHNLKTELVMTGDIGAWLHFFNLRLYGRTGKAHPMIKELAEQLYNDFENKTPISKKLIDNWAAELWENENE